MSASQPTQTEGQAPLDTQLQGAERSDLFQLLMQAPAAIAVFRGPTHIYEIANPAYQRMVHKSGFVGLPVREAFPEAEGQGLFEIFDHTFQTGEPFFVAEMPVDLGRKGSGVADPGYYAFNLEPIRSPAGVITGLMAVCVEVTEQVLARHAVEAARKQLGEIFEQVPAIVGVVTAPDQRYILANPGLRRLYGNRQLLGRTRSEAHPELAGQGINEAVAGVFRTGRRYTAKETLVRIDRNADGQLKDGFFNLIYEPIQDHQGVHSVVLFAIEVTDEVRARQRSEQLQRELQVSEASLRLLAALSEAVAQTLELPDVLAAFAKSMVPQFADWIVLDLLNEEGKLERATVAHGDQSQADLAASVKALEPSLGPSFHTELGADGAILVGDWNDEVERSLRDLELPRLRRALGIRSAIVAPLITRGRRIGTATYLMVESDRRFTEADRALSGEAGRRLAAAIDNARLYRSAETERRRAEEASNAKDEFLAVVSHELRTPLTSMLGWVQVLRSDSLSPERQGKALETIERNARSQARLIEDLLDVSQIISGKLRLEVETLDLSALAEAAVESVRPTAMAKDIRLKTTLTSGAFVRGDPRRLQQVVWNLLSNAIKFTPRGGAVNVVLERVSSSLQMTVTDTGKGIAPEFLPHVFDRFRQGHTGSTRAFGGLGLGLSIVRHVVELHGGMVEAHSAGENQGASLVFRIPAAALRDLPEPSADAPHAKGSYECPPELQGLKVLVVDDELDTRQLLAELLGQCGVRVFSAGNVTEALRLVKSERPDAIVSDVGMPDEDGYSFATKLRKLTPAEGGRTPAVALTAYTRPSDRRKALQAGFNMHVPKPIDPEELLVVLVSVTGHGKV